MWNFINDIFTDQAFILCAHMNKNEDQDIRHRASGSTDIIAGADCAFAIEKINKETSKLYHVKSRWGEEIKPFKFSLASTRDYMRILKGD